ncbi:hypothetical protein K0M31_003837, partial [Melipona bicolor]
LTQSEEAGQADNLAVLLFLGCRLLAFYMLKATVMPTDPPAALYLRVFPTRSITSPQSRGAARFDHEPAVDDGFRRSAVSISTVFSSLFPPRTLCSLPLLCRCARGTNRDLRIRPKARLRVLTCFARGRILPGPSGGKLLGTAKEKRSDLII